MIELSGLKKRYGGRVVLDIPALRVQPGERVALLGANGSGKSTLLRLIAGTIKPDAGALTVSAGAAGAAYLPQNPYAFDCSVKRNVLLALPRGAASEAAAMRALALVGMERMADARGGKLSGGETQRMALARVLARPHALLLLDEPTSSTDIAAGDAIERALLDYASETRAAMLLATHAPSQAARVCDRVLLLCGGRIVEDGAPERVLYAPQSAEGAEFLRHWRF